MQVIQARTRAVGERVTLILDKGAELTVPSTEIQFQGDSIDQIAKYRLARIDSNNVQSQVEFIEWAIRYNMNGLAKLQLDQLIRKYPQSSKLQLLGRRIESNELMKQQQADNSMASPDVAKVTFTAPLLKPDGKIELSKKQIPAKNMARGMPHGRDRELSKKAPNSPTPPKTLPSIAITKAPLQAAHNAPTTIGHSTANLPMLQQQPRKESTTMAPENSADPFDPEIFNRMHAKSKNDIVPQEAVPIETRTIIRR